MLDPLALWKSRVYKQRVIFSDMCPLVTKNDRMMDRRWQVAQIHYFRVTFQGCIFFIDQGTPGNTWYIDALATVHSLLVAMSPVRWIIHLYVGWSCARTHCPPQSSRGSRQWLSLSHTTWTDGLECEADAQFCKLPIWRQSSVMVQNQCPRTGRQYAMFLWLPES